MVSFCHSLSKSLMFFRFSVNRVIQVPQVIQVMQVIRGTSDTNNTLNTRNTQNTSNTSNAFNASDGSNSSDANNTSNASNESKESNERCESSASKGRVTVPKRMNFRWSSKGEGGGIFNPKIYIANFGPLNWALKRAFRKKLQYDFPKMRGVKRPLEFFRTFICFGTVTVHKLSACWLSSYSMLLEN